MNRRERGTQMGYKLRHGLSFCEVSNSVVFLDVVADRYFRLAPDLEANFRAVADGRSEAAPELVATGLVFHTEDASQPHGCSSRTVAQASLLDVATRGGNGPLLAASLLSLALVRRSLHRRGLATTLAGFEKVKSRLVAQAHAPVPHAKLVSVAAGFERSARLVSSQDQCLPRSIALGHLALRLGIPVEVLLGVRLSPFGAHCWVQAGRWLVNDRVDTVRNYVPVLVL